MILLTHPYISYLKGQLLTLYIEKVCENAIFDIFVKISYLLTHECHLFETWKDYSRPSYLLII